MTESSVLSTAEKVEAVVNNLAPIMAAVVPGAAPVVSGVEAAESVAGAVAENIPHHTAASDIAVGLTALAASPAVQSSPAVAAKVSVFAKFFASLLADLGIK